MGFGGALEAASKVPAAQPAFLPGAESRTREARLRLISVCLWLSYVTLCLYKPSSAHEPFPPLIRPTFLSS